MFPEINQRTISNSVMKVDKYRFKSNEKVERFDGNLLPELETTQYNPFINNEFVEQVK